MKNNDLTTDEIAVAVVIPGLYDGTAVYLMKDGTFVNRFRRDGTWPARKVRAADTWILMNGSRFREANRDLLEVLEGR